VPARASSHPFPSLAGLQGFRKIAAEQGAKGLFRGWVPTMFGYSAQGAFKVRRHRTQRQQRQLAR
jgi:solute carrier family 25 phosphate transporter 3